MPPREVGLEGGGVYEEVMVVDMVVVMVVGTFVIDGG